VSERSIGEIMVVCPEWRSYSIKITTSARYSAARESGLPVQESFYKPNSNQFFVIFKVRHGTGRVHRVCPSRLGGKSKLLYYFVQFLCHASHPISENPCNNFFSRFVGKTKSHVPIRIERNSTVCGHLITLWCYCPPILVQHWSNS
jgi:hypothetical protein